MWARDGPGGACADGGGLVLDGPPPLRPQEAALAAELLGLSQAPRELRDTEPEAAGGRVGPPTLGVPPCLSSVLETLLCDPAGLSLRPLICCGSCLTFDHLSI